MQVSWAIRQCQTQSVKAKRVKSIRRHTNAVPHNTEKLSTHIPEFANSPPSWWRVTENRIAYFDWLKQQTNLNTLDDLYQLTHETIIANHGEQLLNVFNNSLGSAIMSTYPEHAWQPWLFVNAPHNWWNNHQNQRMYLDWLYAKLGFRSMEDWYSVTISTLRQNKGRSLLHVYRSPAHAIMAHFPDHEWLPWRFEGLHISWWKKKQNQRLFMEWARKQLGISDDRLEEFYNISIEDIKRLGGEPLIRIHRGLRNALKAIYPEHTWLLFKFNEKLPKTFWQSSKHQYQYLMWLGEQLGYTRLEDWYKIQKSDFVRNKGLPLLVHFDVSPSQCVMHTFPEHEWCPWLFSSTPRGFWKHQFNRYKYFTWLSEKLGLKSLTDLYKITNQWLIENEGSALLVMYNNSARHAVMSAFPDHEWLEWKFDSVPRNWWDYQTNQRRFLDWALKDQMKYTDFNQFYNFSKTALRQLGGAQILKSYRSVPEAIAALYPEHKWDMWKFSTVPKKWWHNKDNQRLFLKHVQQELGFTTMDGWYNVTAQYLIEQGASTMLKMYGDSVSKMLLDVFPDHKWDIWEFSRSPTGFWEKQRHDARGIETIREYLESLAKKLQLSDLSDWYNVSINDIGSKAVGRLKSVGGIHYALMLAYPNHNWEPKRLFSPQREQKRNIYENTARSIFKQIFSGHDIAEHFMWQSTTQTSPFLLEADIYIKDERIAVEVQGIQHYFDVLRYGEHRDNFQRDAEKCYYFATAGMWLVEIPFWCELDRQLVLTTLRSIRPDIKVVKQ